MSTPNDDVLPENVRAEVDAIRESEGLDDPKPAEPEEETPVRLSRRAQKEQERQEELSAAREKAEKAAEAIEQLRREREEDRARADRLERTFAELANLARQPVPVQQEAPRDAGDWRDKYDKQMKKAKEALEKGQIDEYHERFSKAQELRTVATLAPRIPDPRQFQQPQQQQWVKPAWVQSVENEFPDVIQHQRGFDTVTAFIGIVDPTGANRGKPETLKKAFERARTELGTKARAEEQREQKRQMLAGGGSGGRPAGSGGRGNAPVVNVKLPKGKDFRQIARASGMTEQEYARAYAAMNPEDVERG